MTDKLCENCIYSGELRKDPSFWKCRHTHGTDLEHVTVQAHSLRRYCDLERAARYAHLPNMCGPEGKYFEPRPPKKSLWERIQELLTW